MQLTYLKLGFHEKHRALCAFRVHGKRWKFVVFKSCVLRHLPSCTIVISHLMQITGPAEGEGAPHFFGNFKELLRKRCFQPPHFESLVSPPIFKVAPRALNKSAHKAKWQHLLNQLTWVELELPLSTVFVFGIQQIHVFILDWHTRLSMHSRQASSCHTMFSC